MSRNSAWSRPLEQQMSLLKGSLGSCPAQSHSLPPASCRDDASGGIVPGLQVVLHIAVGPSAGHPAQVQLCAAQAADVGAALEDALDHVEHPVRLLPLIGGGAHDDQGLFHLAHVADVDGLAVEIGPLAQLGHKGLVPEGVIAAAEHQLLPVPQGQGYAALVAVVDQVGGAVDGV